MVKSDCLVEQINNYNVEVYIIHKMGYSFAIHSTLFLVKMLIVGISDICIEFLNEILDLTESVSEEFPTYSSIYYLDG